jgi:hypothetical protein
LGAPSRVLGSVPIMQVQLRTDTVEFDERPWAQKSALWGREEEIRDLVRRGYSAAQIIRLLKLTNSRRMGPDGKPLPISRTWLIGWIARNGMRKRAAKGESQRVLSAATPAVHPQPSPATTPQDAEPAPLASPARPDDRQSAPPPDSVPAALPPTARELREEKAKQYVRDALNPLVQKALKIVEESKK